MREFFPILTEVNVPANTTIGGEEYVNLSAEYQIKKAWLVDNAVISPAVGAAGDVEVTFAGTYVAGDFVRVTLTSQARSSQFLTKSYTHTVQAGATTVTDVAAAFAALITADITAGLNDVIATATSALGVLTITQAGDDKAALKGVAYTDSAAGTVAVVETATTYSEGQPSDLVDAGVPAGDINLASYDTVKITLSADAAIPFIDSAGKTVKEIKWYGPVGQGAILATRIG
jgi:hypothetical protein